MQINQVFLRHRWGIQGGRGLTAHKASALTVVLNANQSLTTGVEAVIGAGSLWNTVENTGGWTVNADGTITVPAGITNIVGVGCVQWAANAGNGRRLRLSLTGEWDSADVTDVAAEWASGFDIVVAFPFTHMVNGPLVAIPSPGSSLVSLIARQDSGGALNAIPPDNADQGAGCWMTLQGFNLLQIPV